MEKSMHAILASKRGAFFRQQPIPKPGRGQLLVKVHTAGLNRADLRVLTLAQEDTPGMEWSGIISKVGPGVEGFKPGDRVMCSGKGGFAEYALAEAGRTVAVPQSMDFRRAGSLMLALHTAHDAVVTHGRVQTGDIVLIHGAASGVGLMAAQIARLAGASKIIGTSRNADRRQALLDHGIDVALDSSAPSWTETIMDATGGHGVDVIVDHVSGPRFNDLIKVAALLGRIVNVGRLGGATGEFDFETHAFKRLSYTGVTFRTRTPEEVSQINSAMLHDLGEALEGGELALPLDTEYPLVEAQQALERMAADRHFGKITLRVEE